MAGQKSLQDSAELIQSVAELTYAGLVGRWVLRSFHDLPSLFFLLFPVSKSQGSNFLKIQRITMDSNWIWGYHVAKLLCMSWCKEYSFGSSLYSFQLRTKSQQPFMSTILTFIKYHEVKASSNHPGIVLKRLFLKTLFSGNKSETCARIRHQPSLWRTFRAQLWTWPHSTISRTQRNTTLYGKVSQRSEELWKHIWSLLKGTIVAQ